MEEPTDSKLTDKANVSAFDWDRLLGPRPDFSDQSVEGRNARQNSPWLHPYTCGNDRSDEAHLAYQARHGGDNGQLVAVEDGWLCPVCGYTQPLERGQAADALADLAGWPAGPQVEALQARLDAMREREGLVDVRVTVAVSGWQYGIPSPEESEALAAELLAMLDAPVVSDPDLI